MNKDYTGKTVHIGIDVHKKSYSIVAISEDVIVKKWNSKAEPSMLITSLEKYFKGATLRTVYEAGFSGYVLHRALVRAGIRNIIINPASVERAINDKVKTDRRDAKKLAIQLSHDILKGIRIPSEAEERARLLTRLRDTLVKDKNRIVIRIKSKLFQFGYLGPDDKPKASEPWLLSLEHLPNLPKELAYVLKQFVSQWLLLNSQLQELKKELRSQSREEEQLRLETIYRSVPGIGEVSSRILSNELGDMRYFSNEKHLFSYLGLTPSESSSGERCRRGGITHCGSSRLRRTLIEVAWMAIKVDINLAEFFLNISTRSNKLIAITAVARKLIGQARACFKNDELYRIMRYKQ